MSKIVDLVKLGKDNGTVEFKGKKYILAENAHIADDGKHYRACAYDESLNKFIIVWETTVDWDYSAIIYNFELDGSDADSEDIPEEVQEAYDWEKEHGRVDVTDESNACDWDKAQKVIECDNDEDGWYGL